MLFQDRVVSAQRLRWVLFMLFIRNCGSIVLNCLGNLVSISEKGRFWDAFETSGDGESESSWVYRCIEWTHKKWSSTILAIGEVSRQKSKCWIYNQIGACIGQFRWFRDSVDGICSHELWQWSRKWIWFQRYGRGKLIAKKTWNRRGQ